MAFAVNTTALNETSIRLAKIPRQRAEAVEQAITDNEEPELIDSTAHKDRYSHRRHAKPSGRADGREDDSSSSGDDDKDITVEERPERVQSATLPDMPVTKTHHEHRHPHVHRHDHKHSHRRVNSGAEIANVPQHINSVVVKTAVTRDEPTNKRPGYAYLEAADSVPLAVDNNAESDDNSTTTTTTSEPEINVVTTTEEPRLVSALTDAFAHDKSVVVVEKNKLASEVKNVINAVNNEEAEFPASVRSTAVRE